MRKLIILLIITITGGFSAFSTYSNFKHENFEQYSANYYILAPWPIAGGKDPFNRVAGVCQDYSSNQFTTTSDDKTCTNSFKGTYCSRIDFTIRNQNGNYSMAFTSVGDLGDYLNQYAVFYIKGPLTTPSLAFQCFLVRNNQICSNSKKSAYRYDIPKSSLKQDQWIQVAIPFRFKTTEQNGFYSSSVQWTGYCSNATGYPEYFDDCFNATNTLVDNINYLAIAIEAPLASIDSHYNGTLYYDELYIIQSAVFEEIGAVAPADSTFVKSVSKITAEIGNNRQTPRMLVNGTEYTTSASALDYSGSTLTFTPPASLEGEVTVYVDAYALETESGEYVPMRAKSWNFIVGPDIDSDPNLINNIILPSFFKVDTEQDISFNITSPGVVDLVLYDMGGKKIGNVKNINCANAGEKNVSLVINQGLRLPPGSYILSFNYSGQNGGSVLRLNYTIEVKL